MSTDIKNYAFEAIARREAHELQLQQKHKNNKRFHENTADLKYMIQEVASSTSAANTQSKKGKYSFSGKTGQREEDHPIYLTLSHPVHENLATQNLQVNVVDKILHELLQSGDSAQNYIQGSRRMKMDNHLHLDNKVKDRKLSGTTLVKSLQSHSKRSKTHMSIKQHKKYRSFSLPRELHNFEMFKPIHELWKGYIMHLLKSVSCGMQNGWLHRSEWDHVP